MFALLKIFLLILGAYALLCLFAYLFADRIAFPAPKPSYSFDPKRGYVMLKTSDGENICALWLENPKAENTILYSHGNGEDIGEIRPFLEVLRQSGFNVLAYDYCGYGQSGGRPGAAKVYPSAEAAWNHLVIDRKISPSNIAVWGYSMGSSAATWLAASKNPRALVIVGGFASAFHAVLPANILPWEMLNNERLIKGAACPVMIIHGTKDRVVPFRNAKRLISAANEPKRLYEIENAGHYNIPELAEKIFYEGTKAFVETLKFPDRK